MKLLMENWREYVAEENERVILTEEELNELLQEIGALKSFMGRMRGGKKFGEHGYGWEAAVEQWEEEDAQKAAQSLGLSGVDTKEDFVAKVQNTINKAEKSGDERAKEAIKSITGKIEKSAPDEPETPVDEPLAPEVPTPGEVATGETTVWGAINQELAKNDVQLSDEETSALRNMLKDQSKAAGIPLNEATAWEEVKYWVGKAGRLEKGGKIIGRGKAEKENKEKIEKALANPAAKTIAEFKKKLEEEYPDFPNTKETVNYALGLTEIWIVYDSIVAATKKKPSEKGYMAPSAANVLIRALYDLVDRYANYLLADPGEHFDEGKKLDERAWGVPKLRNKAMESSLEAAYGTASETGAAWEPETWLDIYRTGGLDWTDTQAIKDILTSDHPDRIARAVNFAGQEGISADQLGAIARWSGSSGDEAIEIAQALVDHSAYEGAPLTSALESAIEAGPNQWWSPEYTPTGTGVIDDAANQAIDQAAEAVLVPGSDLAPNQQALLDLLKDNDIRSWGPNDSPQGWPQKLLDKGVSAEDVQSMMQDLGLEIPQDVTNSFANNQVSPEALRAVRQAMEPEIYGDPGTPFQPAPNDPEWLIPDSDVPVPDGAGAEMKTALADAGIPDPQAAEMVTGNTPVDAIQQTVEKLPTDALEPFQHAIKGVGATDLAAFQVAGFWLTNVGLPAYAISRVLIKLLRIKGKISSRKKEINKLLQGIDEVPETSGFAGEETNIRELVGKIATIVDADTASALYNQLAKELRRLGYEKMLQQEGLLLLREETIDLSNIKIPPEKRREVGLLLLKSLRPIGADINLGGELLNAAELEAAAPPEEPAPEEPTADAAEDAAAGVDLSAVYTIITDAARADKIAQIIYRVLTSMGVEVIKPSPAEAGDWQAAKMAAENLKKENKVILERWHQLAGIKSTFLSN